MSQEISTVGSQFRSALDRYTRACSSTRDTCLNGGQINNRLELLTKLEKESDDIALYIHKLEYARAAVQAARSSIPKVAPISALPAEILARIFHLVLPGQFCLVQRGYIGTIERIKYPICPDALAHVCSFWRRVAITSPGLWTHIDIALDHSLNPGLSARAKVYATRAGQLPLEIHISDPGSEREKERQSAIRKGKLKPGDPIFDESHVWDDLHDFKILASDSANIKILEMDLCVYTRFRETYYTMLEYFFARCKPGVLTKYVARCNSPWVLLPFIEPAETPHSSDGALLAVPIHQLDEVWLGISSVRVNGLCPYWNSKMYQGLVELYIGRGVPDISMSDLVSILRSSPKLQVFHFQTEIEDLTDAEEVTPNINPVYLEDLRELSLMVRDSEITTSHVLRWITPGQRPLRLSLADDPHGVVADFCCRANVTQLYVWCPGDLTSILNQCRRLETLVLNELDSDTHGLYSILPEDDDIDDADADGESQLSSRPISPSATRIDTLYLLWYSEIIFEEIQVVVKKYSIQRLLIYHAGRFSYQADTSRIFSKNTRNIRAKLSTIASCPIIEYHPDGYPERYTEGELDDPDGWIRESARS
ncbi:F-box-like domain protein [Rhizoctonia solani 123E]|uniref:F-box-like domain protein n=1 Tax=Rhizoctonia solani 123E TaxID=1423351 RepID=A0A074RTC7_9AGAM|nr:F-box-like domain protein [Rhizoctonia solani 123E]